MKKITCLILSAILMLSLVSCNKMNKDKSSDADALSTQISGTIKETTESNQTQTVTTYSETTATTSGTSSGSTQNNQNKKSEELLQSVNADLDADGKEEVIQAYKVTGKSTSADNVNEVEGLLRIKNSTIEKEISFIKKNEGLTGVMSSMDIRDLDGDGSKDIFIIIPDAGAAFSINYFFLYSFKKDKAFSYTSDSELNTFTGNFTFTYKGNGILEIANSNYNFTAKMDITSKSKGIKTDDESNNLYENSWVEPVPVVINENSKLSIIKDSDGKPEIKVPLPVFGQATSDMIGEVDLYYRIDNNFLPYMHRFDIMDFTDTGSVKAGEAQIFK